MIATVGPDTAVQLMCETMRTSVTLFISALASGQQRRNYIPLWGGGSLCPVVPFLESIEMKFMFIIMLALLGACTSTQKRAREKEPAPQEPIIEGESLPDSDYLYLALPVALGGGWLLFKFVTEKDG